MDRQHLNLLVVSTWFPPAWSWGGPVVSIWNMCRGLVHAGARVRVLTTNAGLDGTVDAPPNRTEEGISIATYPVLRWGGRIANRYALAPGLGRPLREEIPHADLCVFQGVWTYPLAIGPRICRRHRVPYVVCPRGVLEGISLSEKAGKKKLYLRLVESRTLAGATAIQFASRHEQERSLPAIGETPSFVCENAIDPGPRVRSDPAWLRETHGIPSDRPVLGIAGRVHPRKGFEVIVPALARCETPVHLVSFGTDEGNYRSRVEEIAREAGVLERVHFMGQLRGETLQRAYASVDLLVVPSFGESFGNAALEAAAQGTETMVSDGVPVGGYLEAQGLGTVLQGTDPVRWAAAIDHWAGRSQSPDPERISRTVRAAYDVGRKGEELLQRYERLLTRDVGGAETV